MRGLGIVTWMVSSFLHCLQSLERWLMVCLALQGRRSSRSQAIFMEVSETPADVSMRGCVCMGSVADKVRTRLDDERHRWWVEGCQGRPGDVGLVKRWFGDGTRRNRGRG